MARILKNFQNAEAPDDDYPYGRIKDKTAGANGTPVNEHTNGDIHQFFAKLAAEAGITLNDLPDNDYSGFQFFEALLALFGNTRKKVIEIGDWNMDTTSFKNINHGLNYKKIRSISVIIRDDFDNQYFSLGMLNTAAGGTIQGGIGVIYGTVDLQLLRLDAGTFDNSSFDATSYNRGWVTIDYEV